MLNECVMCMRSWARYLSLTTLLQYNSHPIQFIHLKYTVQQFLLYSQMSAPITTVSPSFHHSLGSSRPTGFWQAEGCGERRMVKPSQIFFKSVLLSLTVDYVLNVCQDKPEHRIQKENEFFLAEHTVRFPGNTVSKPIQPEDHFQGHGQRSFR